MQNSALNAATSQPRLNTAHILAMVGVLLLAAQAYTWIGFFGNGIHTVEPPEPFNPTTYWGARFFEVFNWAMLIYVLAWVVKRCRAEGRLTFDAQFMIAGALTYWCDPIVEFFQPIFFNTSYYIHVRDWTGFMPFVVNPDAGVVLEPYLAYFPIYVAGFLSCAVSINALMKRVLTWRPNTSVYSLFAMAFVIGAILEVIMEVIWLRLELISYPGAPDFLALYVGDLKMPWIEWVTAGIVFGGVAMVRYYVNEKGQRITERGLERYSVPVQRLISTVALVAILNSLVISISLADSFVGLYSDPYRPQPAHLINDACDLPGGPQGTRYGPCPGSPGFKMPLTGSLEGPNPYGRN